MKDTMTLDRRSGLPDALKVLLDEHPRDLWESDANFDGLTRFWLSRHMLFRDLLARMTEDAAALADQRTEAAPRNLGFVGRLGQALVTELHGHHRIEDLHYFPRLAGLEPRLERGFDILDADHQALDGQLHELATATNRVLRAEPIALAGKAAALHDNLTGFAGFLDRHLIDEEDLVVPVILTHGAALEGGPV
ncbi:hemerythrin domain-containing protein [Rhodovulum iodosum]|nr:hemerythrin domain-containing protein [Rhodovulum robiginosum]RSK31427.1 hemerythrin domain-containing protein [Rhodovulum robiginosum]